VLYIVSGSHGGSGVEPRFLLVVFGPFLGVFLAHCNIIPVKESNLG
jgi:hypothetical protein